MQVLAYIINFICFGATISGVLLTSILRRHVDWGKLQEKQGSPRGFSPELLPKDHYTATGQKLWWWRNASFLVVLVSVLLIIFLNNFR